MSIYLLATLDTKGQEAAFIRQQLISLGHAVHTVDVGALDSPAFEADTGREQVFEAAGVTLAGVQAQRDRGEAIAAAARGAAQVIQAAFDAQQLSGLIAIGGSAGTTIGTTAMRKLPLGVPKLMVSTMASGPVRHYVGDKDILMMNSVVDIAGLNRISRVVLHQAAAAIAGMVAHPAPASTDDRPLVAATMFGVTTPCVQRAREILEQHGYEVLIFHATGNGGQAMESLIQEGLIAGVLDITTTELADELVGGVLSAGPDRLTAASAAGVPQVVSVGATDMVNFAAHTPSQFSERLFYQHNPTVTLMRTTAEECTAIGKEIAEKVIASTGPAAIMLPLAGVSAIDCEGQAFDDPTARQSLFSAIREHHGQTQLIEMDCHINDPEFAEAAAKRLIELMSAN